MRRWCSCVLVVVAAISIAACGSSSITAARIERAIAPTFANLVGVQMNWLELPPLAAADFAVRASCRRMAAGDSAGSGEWTCILTWKGLNRRIVRDSYELFVTADGCYSATASGDAIGGPALKTESGRDVRNLLYAFEGCFDTT
jgi:ABC-2 type transport system permease protein